MNLKRAGIGVATALLIVGTTVLALGYVGYVGPFQALQVSEDERERDSRLRLNVVPSSRDLKAMLRKLTEAHDRMAKGDREAARTQNGLREEIAASFDRLSVEDWRDRRNYQSMMHYVLAGGMPEAISGFLRSGAATRDQRRLAKGVWSFLANRPKTALKLIGDVDPRSIDPSLAAPMALALASMKSAESPESGIALFDEARLQAPGTAVEEAAMRREIPVLLKQGQVSRALQLASGYVRRFGKSVHAKTFYDEFGTSLAAADIANTNFLLREFAGSVDAVDASEKADLFVAISHKALLAGRIDLAKGAADLALRSSPENSTAGVRAKLFAAAADAPTVRAQSAIAVLESIPNNQLRADDSEIRDAARSIALSVTSSGPLEVSGTGRADLGRGKSGSQAGDGPTDTHSIINRVSNALKHVDAIISGAEQ